MNSKSELLTFIEGLRSRVEDGSIVGIGIAAAQSDGSILTAWKAEGHQLHVMAATAQLQYRLCEHDPDNDDLGALH